MKIYEKPMASFEMINVEDVITDSAPVNLNSEEMAAIQSAAGTDNVIIFQW